MLTRGRETGASSAETSLVYAIINMAPGKPRAAVSTIAVKTDYVPSIQRNAAFIAGTPVRATVISG